MSERVFVIPILPGTDVGQNARGSWQKTDRAAAAYRHDVYEHLRMQCRELIPAQPIEHASIEVVAFYCRKRPARGAPEWLRWQATRRARDVQNLAGDTKALIDALTPYRQDPPKVRAGRVVPGSVLYGVGVIAGDDAGHVPDIRWRFAPPVETFAEERIEVTVTDLDAL